MPSAGAPTTVDLAGPGTQAYLVCESDQPRHVTVVADRNGDTYPDLTRTAGHAPPAGCIRAGAAISSAGDRHTSSQPPAAGGPHMATVRIPAVAWPWVGRNLDVTQAEALPTSGAAVRRQRQAHGVHAGLHDSVRLVTDW